MSILIDLEYKNGFSISVDADLILGKSAYAHIKIASVKGKARIQFTRIPFTHWNFAFVEVNLRFSFLNKSCKNLIHHLVKGS